jgi:hypothetical protein
MRWSPLFSIGFLGWVGLAVAALAALFFAGMVYLTVVMVGSDRATDGVGYYGMTTPDRAAFRVRLRRHAFLLGPLIRLLARLSPATLERATFTVDGVPGPRGSCSEESFESAMNYTPTADDVFVVTQMKCGTTWMQHVVYEVLMRGRGDLVDSGTALYGVCPWLEGRKSVAVADAPLLGSGPRARIIKTHLPADACPAGAAARYIYVSRHPGSCFASCADFLRENMGPFTPDMAAVEEWFRSPTQMWWGTWPRHVAGWWRRAQETDTVLWVRFEEMKEDLPAVIARVAAFLGVEGLTEAEVSEIVEKCSFSYMKENQNTFEMHPPHLLAFDAELFRRGTGDRFNDLPSDVNERMLVWCAKEIEGSGFPMTTWYPSQG